MKRTDSVQEAIASAALDWFLRLREEDVSQEERSQFAQWLLSSPDHVAEYLAVAQSWGDVGLARGGTLTAEQVIRDALAATPPSPNVVAFPNRSTLPPIAEPRRRRRGLLIALTSMAAMLIVSIGLAYDHWLNPSHIRTAAGEQRIVTLEDGSIVNLNTRSRIRVSLGTHERRIQLLDGEVRFTVAKDAARPFIVETDDAIVRAVGTVFNVRALNHETAVAVFEGKVAVLPQPHAPAAGSVNEPVSLSAGERAAVSATGTILPGAGPSIDRASRWVEGRITFVDETLESIVTELNRYQRKSIVIADDDTGALRVSGTYGTNSLTDFIEYLQNYRGVQVETNADGGYVLSKQ
ncbi:FecR family protein [Steroidobacter sp.]|uniref:FecR family protein n=1 Tax=Steroidobacter sp. TaxID=1978227 RepID=UPI001A513511|nr:FecR domain-containing protein [Steroidobacter sp.]MBL8267603.1 FecR domain-containing protein [Steroidobacter sp.]